MTKGSQNRSRHHDRSNNKQGISSKGRSTHGAGFVSRICTPQFLTHQLYNQLASGSERHARKRIRVAFQRSGFSRQFASKAVPLALNHFREARANGAL